MVISGAFFHALAVKGDGSVRGWGRNGYGQLGNNITADRRLPVAAIELTGVISVAANEGTGDRHATWRRQRRHLEDC